MKSILRIALLLLPPLALPASAQQGVRDYARLFGFKGVKLSPTGDYVAATVPSGGQTNLVMIRLSDMKVTGGVRGGLNTHVFNFWWVNDERIVVSMAESEGPLDMPYLTGELMAVNADGSRISYLYGHRGSASSGARVKKVKRDYGFGNLIHPLLDDPQHAVITIAKAFDVFNAQALERYTTPAKIDVYTGDIDKLAQPPMEGSWRYLVDDQARVRYAVGSDSNSGEVRTFVRNLSAGEWRQISGGSREAKVIPLRIAADDRHVFMETRSTSDRYCLARQSLETDKVDTLACDEQADLDQVFFASDGRTPLFAAFSAGKQKLVPIEPEHPDAKVISMLAKTFEGQQVTPTSWTRDGSKLVVQVDSDRNPGDFYLFDRKTNKASYLLSRAEWIDPDVMSETRPISYTSRDGKTIFGYLTLPRGKEASKLPLVVNPHGGPFGIRDGWDWDADAQFLASRGYAVLKVNFRGSGGYGAAYQDSAKQGWGTMMIDDITDGVRWTVQQGLVDASRICIYGASYGGYASLMSAVREPDLYRCAIGYVGVYDLALLQKDTDISESRGGREFLMDYVGDDPKVLKEQSPVTHIDRLKADVFIVHGEDDRRAPFTQAKALREALRKKGHPHEWLTKLREGHGFANEDNRVELYERMLAFLDRNIGDSAKVAPPP